MTRHYLARLISSITCTLVLATSMFAEIQGKVSLQWGNVIRESRTTLSLSVCVEPPMRRGSPIHDQLFKALRDLNADYLHFQSWRPYPRIAVAELEPPHDGKTSWDFSLLDPILIDFIEAAGGRPVVVDISTIPQWMFKTPKPVPYPSDPNEITWVYGGAETSVVGTELSDASMKEVVDYFARVASWYTKGGLRDEYGQWHESGHHLKFDYWEVLNEVEYEHKMTPQFYTALYDAIVTEVHKVAPETRFIGLALGPSGPLKLPEYFEYFLDPKNHKPGIPLDAISYHFYAQEIAPDETPEVMQYTVFSQADRFINAVRYIELIRQRLSPGTRTHINEIGTILPDSRAPKLLKPIPLSYWNLSGAMFAYIYAQLALLGIDVAHESELIDYPSQYAGTTLVDWETGRPNARYWVLKLLRDNFGPGDSLVETKFNIPGPPEAGDSPTARNYVYAQGFLTRDGNRKILLVNKRDRDFEISIPGSVGATVDYVDQTTGYEPAAKTTLKGEQLALRGLAVAVVSLRK
jgi:hypothetical protein